MKENQNLRFYMNGSVLDLVFGSCADQSVDAVVNAANACLLAGDGICGAIFQKAGMEKLTKACKKFKTPLLNGEVAVTPAFDMTNTSYIIHAVGPDFREIPEKEGLLLLFFAYYNSLLALKNHDLHSIAFPLISAGIFSGDLSRPSRISATKCVDAIQKFTTDFPDYPITVNLCAFTEDEFREVKLGFMDKIR